MTSASSILEIIQHYQRNIERSQNKNDEVRMLYCINKLYKLPVEVDHLQETGIGKTINSLRKYNGDTGIAAKSLVSKWKAMVAAEENNDIAVTDCSLKHDMLDKNHASNALNDTPENKYTNVTELSRSNATKNTKPNNLRDRRHVRDKFHSADKPNSRSNSHEHNSSYKKKNQIEGDSIEKKIFKEKKRDTQSEEHASLRHDDKTLSMHHNKYESKSTLNSKGRNTLDKRSHSRKCGNSSRVSEKNIQTKNGKSHQFSSDKIEVNKYEDSISDPLKFSTTTSSNDSGYKRVRQISDENDACELKSPKSKMPKQRKEVLQTPEDGIDSSMGANFGDVLGMLNKPTKKNKKTVHNIRQTTTTLISCKDPSYSSLTSTAASTSSAAFVSSNRSPNMKPESLICSAKLPPLDLCIALELPSISNNYKPLPLNQTVMDCVFNTVSSSSSKLPPLRTLTDAEALSHGISSKTMRTKIYSGVKSGQIHQVPNLFDLCIRVLQKNIDALEYTGGVPFEVLRHVLERATPQQLLTFEEYNPYLMEDSDVLWQQHVQRNYRTQKREEMETWREMFLRCQEDRERKLNVLAETIKQSQKLIAAPVRKTQLAFVDSMVKPPRNVQRKQEQYGTKSKLIATPAARVAALSSVTPNAAKAGDTRLRVGGGSRDAAQIAHIATRPKKAPLMAKTLQFMRGRNKRC